MTRSTLLHLRLPFSFFLMPIFMMSLISADNINWTRAIFAFIVLHVLVYPAGNGFNTFYDRDKSSIGGIKNPPTVTGDLLWVTLLLDLVAVTASFYVDWIFGLGILIYGSASKAYSYDRIRLKRFPILSWLMIGIGHGGLMVILVYGFISASGYSFHLKPKVMIIAGLTTCYLLASYPLTQIYQHDEDSRRGDETLSLMLGIRGTFRFTAIFFALVFAGFIIYFYHYAGMKTAALYVILQFPGLVYFQYWKINTFKNSAMANYENAMRLNLISSAALNLLCVIILSVKGSEVGIL